MFRKLISRRDLGVIVLCSILFLGSVGFQSNILELAAIDQVKGALESDNFMDGEPVSSLDFSCWDSSPIDYFLPNSLEKIDIMSPSHAIPLSSFDDIEGAVEAVLLRDGLAYLRCSDGVQILNITNISTPLRLGKISYTEEYSHGLLPVGNWEYDLALSGSYLFTYNKIVDVSNPSSPKIVSDLSIASSTGFPAEIEIANSHAYTLNYKDDELIIDELTIFDIRNPLFPIVTARYPLPSFFVSGIEISEGIAYVLTQDEGLYLLNVSNPYHPMEINHFPIEQISLGISLVDKYAFISASTGLHILDISDPSTVTEVSFFSSEKAVFETTVNGSLVFLCKKGYGLEILNITNPSSIVSLGQFTDFGRVYNIAIDKNHAFVAADKNGLFILDMTNASSPTTVANVRNDEEGDMRKICIKNEYAYLADLERGLVIMDVSDPFHPTKIGVSCEQVPIHDLYLNHSNNLLYLATGESRLRILDVSNPASPIEIGNYTLGEERGALNSLAVSGELALLSFEERGVMIFNVSDPTAPTNITRILDEELVKKVVVQKNYAFLVIGEFDKARVMIIDISDPAQPKTVTTFARNLWARTLAVDNNNLLYLVTDTIGLRMFNVSDPSSPEPVGWYYFDYYPPLGEFSLVGETAIITNDKRIIFFDLSNFFIRAKLYQRNLYGAACDDDGLFYVANGVDGLSIFSLDSDKDGLTDYEEGLLGSNSYQHDLEGDGMVDGFEVGHGLAPLLNDATGDADGDGLSNLEEYQSSYWYDPDPLTASQWGYFFRPDPDNPDTDQDGLSDFEEVSTYLSHPCSPDTDLDKLDDLHELLWSTNINGSDSDSDSLEDGSEVNIFGTDPTKNDTDADGIPDAYEVLNGLNPLFDDTDADADGDGLSNWDEYQIGTDPTDPDCDDDGLTDYQELQLYNTDPYDPDSDNDGLTDSQEVLEFTTDPNNDDSDDDGLIDSVEVYDYFTDPNNPDTDGDGFTDKEEIERGFDPNETKDNPRARALRIFAISFGSAGGLVVVLIGGFFLIRTAGKIRRKKHEV